MNKKNNFSKEFLINLWELSKIEYKNFKGETISSYIAKVDANSLKEGQDLSYYFRTHILPQPFFGNIDNPEIVILALNPKYSPIDSENECKAVLEKKEINGDFNEYIKHIDEVFNVEKGHTLEWWSKVFNGLISKNDVNEKTIGTILSKVAIINFCGYHSSSFEAIPNNVIDEKMWINSTQTQTKDYVQYIIKEKSPLIIRLWGNEWNTVLGTLKEKELNEVLFVNAKCAANGVILNGIHEKNKENFKEEFKLFLEGKSSAAKLKSIVEDSNKNMNCEVIPSTNEKSNKIKKIIEKIMASNR